MVSQLGFLPEGNYDAVEITKWPPEAEAERYTLICDSDAHYLEDVGTRTFSFEAATPSFRSLAEALRGGETKLSIA
jgi:hypothetical protein